MKLIHSEIKDLGRFIRAMRMATDTSDVKELPRRRRRVLHLTQDDLADLIGVSTVVISQIEQGRYPNLGEGLLSRIAHVLSFTTQQEMYAFGLLNERPLKQKQQVIAPRWLVESIGDSLHPVVLLSSAYDMLAYNEALERMFGGLASDVLSYPNAFEPVLAIPELKLFFLDWEEYTSSMLSGLRMSYAVYADLRDHILNLVSTLAEHNDFILERWTADYPLVVPKLEKAIDHPELGLLSMAQITTFVVEAPQVLKVEYLPADEESQAKWANYRG